MKNIRKILNTGIALAITLCASINLSASFRSTRGFGQPTTFAQATQQQVQQAQQQNNTQYQQSLNWTTETAIELKRLTQASQESTEAIKLLSDKVTTLENTIKEIQAAADMLKETVSQNFSTSIKMLNESLQAQK